MISAQPGRGARCAWPAGEGIRVDTHIVSGSRVPPFYDSLLGKIIAHGPDRAAALARLRAAIAATRIDGRAHQPGLPRGTLLDDPEFQRGRRRHRLRGAAARADRRARPTVRHG